MHNHQDPVDYAREKKEHVGTEMKTRSKKHRRSNALALARTALPMHAASPPRGALQAAPKLWNPVPPIEVRPVPGAPKLKAGDDLVGMGLPISPRLTEPRPWSGVPELSSSLTEKSFAPWLRSLRMKAVSSPSPREVFVSERQALHIASRTLSARLPGARCMEADQMAAAYSSSVLVRSQEQVNRDRRDCQSLVLHHSSCLKYVGRPEHW
ncbi:hypothetical protein KC335_g108 [Hortaea werneckii]|nr:hypothetical protein KC335_g108 [Hortaea werneckii]